MPVVMICTRLALASQLSTGSGLLSFVAAIFRRMSPYLFLSKATLFFVRGSSQCIQLLEQVL